MVENSELKIQDVTAFRTPWARRSLERERLVNNDPAECKVDFRVEKADTPLLVEALRVPPILKCYNGIICDGTETLCIELKRFAYPCRYWDMISMFGRAVAELCMISNEVVDWIYYTRGHKVTH